MAKKTLQPNEAYDIKSSMEVDFIYVSSGKLIVKYITASNKEPQLDCKSEGQYIDQNYYMKDSQLHKHIHKIYAKELTELISLSSLEYITFIDPKNCYDTDTAMFILQALPLLELHDLKVKSDMISLFRKCLFHPKEIIMDEGDVSSCAYLIYEGECTLKCKNNSALNNGLYDDPKHNYKVVPRGFLSPTTLQCIFGTISRQQWVGDDSLFSDSALIYSAEALSTIVALQIKKSQLSTIPQDVVECIIKTSKSKLYWLKERIFSINKVNSQIINSDQNLLFQVSIKELGKRFPIASEAALRNLRVQKLSKSTLSRKSLLGINIDRNVNRSVCFKDMEKIESPSYIIKKPDKFLTKLSHMRTNTSVNDLGIVKLSCASVIKFGDVRYNHKKKKRVTSMIRFQNTRKNTAI